MALPADLVFYCSANMPAADSGTSGGAIDLDWRAELTQPLAPGALEVVSSSAGDTTPQATVRARDTTGAVVSQTVTLTGVTAVSLGSLGTVTRVLKVSLDADAAGIVTLRMASAGATIGTIPIGERGFLCIHREAQASASATTVFYYKGFWKNTGSQTLSSGSLLDTGDASRIAVAVAASNNDSGSVTNRLTAPAGPTFGTSATLPASLGAGDAIGVWFRFTHPAAEATLASTITNTINGTAS